MRLVSAFDEEAMRYTAMFSVLAILSLSACTHVPTVVSAGANTYVVSAGGGIYEQDPSRIREQVYTSANTHCSKLGKTMEPVKVDERPYALGRNTANVALTFTCR
jgi:hypothetical protein